MPSKCITGYRNRKNFFVRFRVVAAGFLAYSGDREDENPVFDDCPTHCDAEDARRLTFCDSCPIKAARDEFREAATEELAKLPGDKFGFDYLYRCVVDVINLGKLPPDAETMTTARLRSIIEGERSRIERIKRWNKKNEPKPTGS